MAAKLRKDLKVSRVSLSDMVTDLDRGAEFTEEDI